MDFYNHIRSLFIFTKCTIHINVLVYVDDLVISSNDSAALSMFKAYLSDCFIMKDLGPLNIFWVLKLHIMLLVSFSIKGSMLWILFFRLAC